MSATTEPITCQLIGKADADRDSCFIVMTLKLHVTREKILRKKINQIMYSFKTWSMTR